MDPLVARTLFDPKYPARLRALEKPPQLVEAVGPLASTLDDVEPRVAIVGTRRASDHAMRYARWLATILAARGVTIVSGGAYGIDAQAHLGALDARGRTIAVLPGGVDARPEDRRALFDTIAARGAIVALQPRGTKATRDTNFDRNAAIAALADDVVVVECPLESGARNTAKHARTLDRRLWVLCGAPDRWRSAGNVWELDHGARPIYEPRRLFQILDLPYEHVPAFKDYVEPSLPPWLAPDPPLLASNPTVPSRRRTATRTVTLPSIATSPEEQRVVEALQFAPLPIDELVARTGLSVGALRALLLTWTVDGVVREGPAGLFRLVTH